ncbi:MAG: hypothetical protein FH756_17485 [Firmicutes bacterium]|nr:hypothetical protein [Bacillota bacterium]
MEVIYNLITGAIVEFFAGIGDSMLDMAMIQVTKIMEMAMDILNNPLVQNAIQLSQIVAGSLLAVALAVECLRSYILYQHGEPTADIGRMLTRVFIAAAAVCSTPWLAKLVYQLGFSLANELGTISSYQVEEVFEGVSLGSAAGMPVTLVIMTLVVLVLWFLILIQSAIRGVELGAISVVGPVMSVGLLKSDEGVFATWWRELVILSMTQALQVLLIKGFLAQGVNMASSGTGPYFAIAWLWVTFKTPSFLRQFAYHTGIGSAAGGVTRMDLVRKMLTRGA